MLQYSVSLSVLPNRVSREPLMFSRYVKQISYEVADLNNCISVSEDTVESTKHSSNTHRDYYIAILYHVLYQTSTPISARYSSISQKGVEGWCGVLSENWHIIIYHLSIFCHILFFIDA